MAKKIVIEEELPSNSNVKRTAPLREDRREQEPFEIVKAKRPRRETRQKAVVRKKSLTQNIAEALVGDSTENVGGYVLHEVLIPAAKNTIQEMVQSGIEMLLFGERRSKSRDRDRSSTKISYGSYYRDRDERRERPRASSYRDKFDLSEIYFNSGRAADEVLTDLCDALEEYEEVSVHDFFDTAGIDGATWAHDKWGWRDLRKAYCTHTRNGYQIVFPDPVELD